MLSIGKTIYLWRTERRLTQEQLARATGIPRPNLSNLERGKQELSLKTLRLLASVLKVTPGTLVDGIIPLTIKGPLELSRKDMDQIADAVFGKGRLTGRKGELAGILKILCHHRIPAANKSKNKPLPGKRLVNTVWLQLKAAVPGEVIRTFVRKIEGRERLISPFTKKLHPNLRNPGFS